MHICVGDSEWVIGALGGGHFLSDDQHVPFPPSYVLKRSTYMRLVTLSQKFIYNCMLLLGLGHGSYFVDPRLCSKK